MVKGERMRTFLGMIGTVLSEMMVSLVCTHTSYIKS